MMVNMFKILKGDTGPRELQKLNNALAIVKDIGLFVYPVGSIYISINSNNPSSFFGGTWVAFGSGKTLVGLDGSQTEFNVVEKIGGSKTHTLSVPEMPQHTHTQNSHTHTQQAHTHVQNAHTHTQNAHTHVQDSHTHIQDAHTHTQQPHSHTHTAPNAPNNTRLVGLLPTIDSSTAGVSTSSTTAVNNNTTATNQNTVAINQNATATNQNTTATNQNATAVNDSTTAVNQDTGGGQAHNNLQPYIVVYFFKRIS